MRIAIELEELLTRPVPVFKEGHLHSLHDRAGHLYMGVAPSTDGWIAAQIFVAHVESSNPRSLAVHDDDLAMIAEVQLPAVCATLRGVESAHIDARVPQFS